MDVFEIPGAFISSITCPECDNRVEFMHGEVADIKRFFYPVRDCPYCSRHERYYLPWVL